MLFYILSLNGSIVKCYTLALAEFLNAEFIEYNFGCYLSAEKITSTQDDDSAGQDLCIHRAED